MLLAKNKKDMFEVKMYVQNTDIVLSFSGHGVAVPKKNPTIKNIT